MSDATIITLIICVTICILSAIGNLKPKEEKQKSDKVRPFEKGCE